MPWNYRVIRTELDNGEAQYGLHEVYYEDDKPTLSSEMPDPVLTFIDENGDDGEAIAELTWTLDRMREALSKPVLDRDEDFKHYER